MKEEQFKKICERFGKEVVKKIRKRLKKKALILYTSCDAKFIEYGRKKLTIKEGVNK